MRRFVRSFSQCVIVLLVSAPPVAADVRIEQLMRLTGAGELAGLSEQQALKDGVRIVTAVKGFRRMTRQGDQAELVDLRERKIYRLDFSARTYAVFTFDDVAEEFTGKQQQLADSDVRFDLRPVGERRSVGGFATRGWAVAMTVGGKGKTLQQGGGLVIDGTFWLARSAFFRELEDFDGTYNKAIVGGMGGGPLAGLLALLGSMLGDTAKRLEDIDGEGTPLAGSMRFEFRPPLETVDGLDLSAMSASMDAELTLVTVASAVADAEVAIPAGFSLETPVPTPNRRGSF